jgi:hypothetical protein
MEEKAYVARCEKCGGIVACVTEGCVDAASEVHGYILSGKKVDRVELDVVRDIKNWCLCEGLAMMKPSKGEEA